MRALPPFRLVVARELHSGDLIPPLYGFAWVEPDRDVMVYLPIPFNVLAGLWRRLVWWLREPSFLRLDMQAYYDGYRRGAASESKRTDDLLATAYRRGYEHGHHAGCADGVKVAEIALARSTQPTVIVMNGRVES